MNDLAKQMAPIRDSIARTLATIHEVERLLITATEAERMEFTSAAEGAVEKARRLLADLNGKAAELPKPTPASVKLPCDCAECCGCKTLEEANAWLLANPGKAESHAKASTMRLIGRESLGDTIDRTLPPGFEVQQFPKGWYPCKDIYGDRLATFSPFSNSWCGVYRKSGYTGDGGYRTEREALEKKGEWLKAAGVDWPEVTGPHEDDHWDIRTKTHWWSPLSTQWTLRNQVYDARGAKESRNEAERELPAACRAWVEMQHNKEAAR